MSDWHDLTKYRCPKHGDDVVSITVTVRDVRHDGCALCYGEWLQTWFPVEAYYVTEPGEKE